MCSGDGRTQSGGVIRAGLKVVLKGKPKKRALGGGLSLSATDYYTDKQFEQWGLLV